MWRALEEAWEWADTSPEYSSRFLGFVISSKIPLLERDAELGVGAPGLRLALGGLTHGLNEVNQLLIESASGPVLPREYFIGPFSDVADYARQVDDALPATISLEELANVDPLVAAYGRLFPSEERPASLNLGMKMRLALALSERTLPEAFRDATLAAISDPFFYASVLVPVGLYVALWLVPEPTTKVLAAALTAFLLTMFVWNDIVDFARAWFDFNSTCISATSEAELRWAGTQLTAKLGEVGFDVFLMSILFGLGKAAKSAISARAKILELERSRYATPETPYGAVTVKDVVPPERPIRNPAPGEVEQKIRNSFDEEDQVGLDIFIEKVRAEGKDSEVALARIPETELRTFVKRDAQRYRTQVADYEALAAAKASYALWPKMRNPPEWRGNILVLFDRTPPTATEILDGQALARFTGRLICLFGDLPEGRAGRRRAYPGIDGTIGMPPEPLSLKNAAPGWARWHAQEALIKAKTHGYSRVTVQIGIRDGTLDSAMAQWSSVPEGKTLGPVFEGAIIEKIILTADDGAMIIKPPMELPLAEPPELIVPPSHEGEREK